MAAIGSYPGNEWRVRHPAKPRCPWCANPNAEEWDDNLCRTHEAEYEGMSLDQLDRRDAEQYAEEADAMGWQTAHNRWR